MGRAHKAATGKLARPLDCQPASQLASELACQLARPPQTMVNSGHTCATESQAARVGGLCFALRAPLSIHCLIRFPCSSAGSKARRLGNHLALVQSVGAPCWQSAAHEHKWGLFHADTQIGRHILHSAGAGHLFNDISPPSRAWPLAELLFSGWTRIGACQSLEPESVSERERESAAQGDQVQQSSAEFIRIHQNSPPTPILASSPKAPARHTLSPAPGRLARAKLAPSSSRGRRKGPNHRPEVARVWPGGERVQIALRAGGHHELPARRATCKLTPIFRPTSSDWGEKLPQSSALLICSKLDWLTRHVSSETRTSLWGFLWKRASLPASWSWHES